MPTPEQPDALTGFVDDASRGGMPVDAGTIDPFTPEWSDEVDPELGDASGEGSYWPIVQQAILFTYDADRTSAKDAPADLTDLWNDPAYQGRYQSEISTGAATTKIVMAGILTRDQDPDGELGVSEEGWQQIEAYFANGSPAVEAAGSKDEAAAAVVGAVVDRLAASAPGSASAR